MVKGHGLSEQFDEARLTVSVVAMLLECTLVELFEAESTSEMIRMKLLTHGTHTLTCNNFDNNNSTL